MSNRPNASRFQLILRIRRRALKRQPRTRLQISRLTCSAISGAMIVRAQTPARAVLSARLPATLPLVRELRENSLERAVQTLRARRAPENKLSGE